MNKIQKWIAKHICKIPEPEQKEIQFIHTEYPVIELSQDSIFNEQDMTMQPSTEFMEYTKEMIASKISTALIPYLIWETHKMSDSMIRMRASISIVDEYNKRRID